MSRPAEREASSAVHAGSREASPEQAYRQRVWQVLPRNYVAHMLHGLLGQTGFRLINAPTFVPAYLLMLSGSDVVVGLGRALQSLGMFVSPLIAANLVEHRKRVLPAGFVIGTLMRLQVLGIALAGLLLPGRFTIYAVCLFLALFGFFMGMQGVIFNYLMSKLIPVERRGILLGLRNALAGLTAGGVAWLGGQYLVGPNVFGHGYELTFLLAFVLTSLGLCMLLLVREPEPPEVRPSSSLAQRLRDVPALLRADRPFTHYFIARALATMGRMAVPFYILYAGGIIGLSGRTLGLLTLAFVLANACTNLFWGMLADRVGFRLVLVSALLLWIASVVLLMQVQTLSGFALAFVGIGAGMGGFMMGAQNMVLEFGTRDDLPLRIALANSAQEGVGVIGPLLGGLLAGAFSYPVLFCTAIALQAAALALIAFYVEEPRRRSA